MPLRLTSGLFASTLLALALVLAAPTSSSSPLSSPSNLISVNQTTCNGNNYTYSELAAYGFVPSDARDKFGDTLGGYGSSIAIDQDTWKKTSNGSYSGMLWAIPDRGWNTEGTLNYQSRIHKFSIDFTPEPSATVKSPASPNLQITYVDSILFVGPDGVPCTGLDADIAGFQSFPGFPPLPVANYLGDGFGNAGPGGRRISLDSEGLILAADGSFWISDEYGPYIYHFSANGSMLAAIAPPDAFIPHRNGSDSFSSDTPPLYNPDEIIVPADPTTGRANNQGFEGLTLSPDGKTLNVLLQSALDQEGGLDDATRRYSRFLSYDISTQPPTLLAEHVVPLPTYSTKKGKTKIAAQSEIHAITSTQFLVLARDSGNGFGDGSKNTESLYRHIDVFDISAATDVKGGSADSTNGSIASADGELNDGITPAKYCSWLDFNVNSELGRFGLHNGGDEDKGLLNEKWESIAVVPVEPVAAGEGGVDADATGAESRDVFIFSLSDNDFITQNGFMDFGAFPYKDSSGYDVNNQALVFRATVPASGG